MGRAILFLSGGMVIIFGMLQLSMSNRQQIIPQQLATYYINQQAENVATSLVELAIEQVRGDQNWKAGFNFDNFMGGSGYVTVFDQSSTSIPDSLNHGSWDEYKVVLYSEVEYEGIEIKTEVLLQRDSFSKYSYFTDYEPSNIYFFSGDKLSGPVHTNGTMNIAGEPVFEGMVTSPNDWRGITGRTNDPKFNGGSNFNSGTRTPPDALQLSLLKNEATSGGKRYDSPIYVEFKNNGTVSITENPGKWWAKTNTFNLNTFNGVISSKEDVYVKGTLNGQVTVHSEDNINIMGDIEYNSNPIDNPNSTDLLGLVSEKNVRVDYYAHTDKGSKDLNIHASIMALGKSFTVDSYNYGSSRGSINLLGGIIQKERGPVGTFSGNSVASGFSKAYEYDERLLSLNPPSFPREKYFSVVYWRDRTN